MFHLRAWAYFAVHMNLYVIKYWVLGVSLFCSIKFGGRTSSDCSILLIPVVQMYMICVGVFSML